MPKFSITLTPRISETDLVGHVNNAAYTQKRKILFRPRFIAEC